MTWSASWPRLPVIPLLGNVVYASVLVALAVVEAAPTLPEDLRLADTTVHAVAYGGQAALLYWALCHALQPLTSLIVAWLSGTAFGVATEILQTAVAVRAAEGVDIVADAFGATAVVIGVLAVRRLVGVARGAPGRVRG